MLPAGNRLTRSRDFQWTVRHGRRAARPTLVVHLWRPAPADADDDTAAAPTGARPLAGLVVSRRVGGSVVRHTVARRLRHVLRPRLSAMPEGTRLVVRALPAAATSSSAVLAGDLDAALRRCGIDVVVDTDGRPADVAAGDDA